MSASSTPAGRRGRLLIYLATALLVVGGTGWLARRLHDRDPLRRLVAAAPREARDLEPRLSGGFAWAPLRAAKRGGADEDPRRMQVRGIAGQILQRDETTPSPHAAALAWLLIGKPRKALARVEAVADDAKSAAMWSDLAAVRYEIAVREDAPEEFGRALAAADQALKLDPDLPEALFNRALVLQRLGLRDAAREAWRRCLAADDGKAWGNEARERLRELSTPLASFAKELERSYDRLAAGDRELARRLVADFPQDARQTAETEILGQWGEAYAAGDANAASRHLAVTRQLALALAERHGEHLLLAAVNAIDAADPAQRRALATAHADYRAARILYSKQRPADTEPLMRSAAKGFAEAKSAMELVALYFAANTVYDQNRVAAAREELRALHGSVPVKFRALRACIEWQLGLCEGSSARWGQALSHLRASTAAFEALGERDNASRVRDIVCDVYETVGEIRASWRERLIVLARLGRITNLRLQSALAGMSRTAIRARDWTAAASLLRIEADSAAVVGDRPLQAEAFFRRALVNVQLGDVASAREDLVESRRVCTAIEDRSLRERCEADQLYVEGIVASAGASAGAAEKLTRAIDFHRQRGRRMFVPELLLARARLAMARGDVAAAASDVEAGIVEVERQRETLPAGDMRAGIFDAAAELFAQAASIQLARGDAARALHFAERGRARLLLDAVAGGPAAIPSTIAEWSERIPTGSVLLDYVVLGGGDVRIFVVERSGISVMRVAAARPKLRAEARALSEAIARDDAAAMHARGAVLYDALIAPVAEKIRNVERLIVAGDAGLMTLPFAALRESRTGRYLVESHTIVTTPSAAAYLRTQERRRERSLARVVAVADPLRGDDSERLPDSAAEVAAIARLYPSAAMLTGLAATREAFLREAPAADVIHFAGHGRVGEVGTDARLLFSGGDLYTNEIASTDLRRVAVAVLAACDTAQGAARAEGVWSVSRAFLMAGLPDVVATLWPLDDALAPRFFIGLHDDLRRGIAPEDAVRAAQLECIRQKCAPASVWASVQLIAI